MIINILCIIIVSLNSPTQDSTLKHPLTYPQQPLTCLAFFCQVDNLTMNWASFYTVGFSNI